jgi:RNA polymerase sigma factor (TIGR02999 family)
MRQILVQRARARHAEKRGGPNADRIALDEAVIADRSPEASAGIDVLELDAALEKLAALDPQQAKIVELRYFGGLTVEEAAAALDISPATVKRHWTLARAWLKKELSPE